MTDKTKQAEPELDPEARVPVLMLLSVRDNDRGGDAMMQATYGQGLTVELPREKAVRWSLRGFCDPVGWSMTPAEIATHARAAFEGLEDERRGSGRSPEQAMLVPMYRRRYERLFALIEGNTSKGEA